MVALTGGGRLLAALTAVVGCEAGRVVEEDSGWATVEIPLAHDADPRDDAWLALGALEVPVREFGMSQPNLEQLFAQVTEGSDEENTA